MKKNIFVGLRILIAILLVQTLYFKFTAHPDSIAIFTKIGVEPFGRIGVGVVELLASILLLIPKTAWIGAGLTIGVLSGAIIMHLTVLGISVNGDGSLFYMGLIMLAISIAILWNYRRNISFLNKS